MYRGIWSFIGGRYGRRRNNKNSGGGMNKSRLINGSGVDEMGKCCIKMKYRTIKKGIVGRVENMNFRESKRREVKVYDVGNNKSDWKWIWFGVLWSIMSGGWLMNGSRAEEQESKMSNEEEGLEVIFARLHDQVLEWLLDAIEPSIKDKASQLWDKMLSVGDEQMINNKVLEPMELIAVGRFIEAINILEEMLESGGDRRHICKCIAIAYILKGNHEKALPYLNEAIWLEPKDPELHLHQGYVMMKQDNYMDAWLSFEKALILDSGLEQGKASRETILKKMDIEYKSAYYHNTLATAYYELGNYEEALKSYQNALKFDPNYLVALHNRSVVERMMHQREKYNQSGLDLIPARLLPIVTSYEYATMAEASYNSLAKAFPPSDWIKWLTSDDIGDNDGIFSRDGFYGVTFINHQKKHIVMALQGSKSTEDIISSIHVLFNCFDRQIICAKHFGEHVQNLISNDSNLKNYSLSFTGHSLGALQAEILGHLFHKDAVTFESPGSNELLHIFCTESTFPSNHCSLHRHSIGSNVITYLPRPNIINTSHGHIGNLIRIYPPLPAKSFRAENTEGLQTLLEIIQKLINVVPGLENLIRGTFRLELIKLLSLSELMILETAHWHSMANICQLLRYEYETGIPIPQKTVIQWPRIFNFYLYWRVTKDCITGEPDDDPHIGPLNKDALKYSNYQVQERNMNTISLSQFSSLEKQFLKEYKQNPQQLDSNFSELDKRILANYQIHYDTVIVNVGISPEHWKKFIQLKAKQVLGKTHSGILNFFPTL